MTRVATFHARKLHLKTIERFEIGHEIYTDCVRVMRVCASYSSTNFAGPVFVLFSIHIHRAKDSHYILD